MEQQWYSWIYPLQEHSQERKPLPGRIRMGDGVIPVPALEGMAPELGISLGSEDYEVRLPAFKKKGFWQRPDEALFWSAHRSDVQNGVKKSVPALLPIGLTGMGETLAPETATILAHLTAVDVDDFADRRAADEGAANVPKTVLIHKPEPDAASPAILRFHALYADPKSRKNKKLLMGYFISPEFLASWRQHSFTLGMLLAVEAEAGTPPFVFLRQLSIAYGIRYRQLQHPHPDGSVTYSYEPQLFEDAKFPGVEEIIRITQMGEPVTRINHQDERDRADEFQECRRMLLAKQQTEAPATEPEASLPERKKRTFPVAVRVYDSYQHWSFEGLRTAAEDIAQVEKLFCYERVHEALQDMDFVREHVMCGWLNLHHSSEFLTALLELSRSYSQSESCRMITPVCAGLLHAKDLIMAGYPIENRLEPSLFHLDNAMFWWYFLRVAFRRSMSDQDTAGLALTDMMTRGLPDVRWECSLLGRPAEDGGPGSGRMISIPVGGHWLHIQLHLSYLQYYWDDQPIWKPMFDWDQVMKLPAGPIFWLLLPLTIALPAEMIQLQWELARRAEGFVMPGCCPEEVGRLLAGYLTPALEERRAEHMVRREIGGTQYSFQVYQDGTLRCFAQSRQRSDRYAKYKDMDTAVEQGMDWLASIHELCRETPLLPQNRLPDYIRIHQYGGPVIEPVPTPTETASWVEVFLTQDLSGLPHVNRLELSWGDRMARPGTRRAASSLVLMEVHGQCMALYFCGRRKLSVYGAIGQPDKYRADGEHPREVFGNRAISACFIHPDRVYLTRQVHELLRHIGEAGQPARGRQWTYFSTKTETKLSFCRIRREWGGFEDEAGRNPAKVKLELPHRPELLCTVNQSGQSSFLKRGALYWTVLEQHLNKLYRGKFTMVQMGWNNAARPSCSVVLLNQDGQFLMLYLNHSEKWGSYWVGDRIGYLNAEKKIHRIDFCGGKPEFYLLHSGPETIRDGLDLLLPNILTPRLCMEKFGQWAYVSKAQFGTLPIHWNPLNL